MSLIQKLLRRKSVQDLQNGGDDAAGPKLNKVLTARDVFFHGVAAIIGTGIFVLTGVAAHDHAGPGIILSFLLAGFACAFVSFAYAELSSMIPVSGSAYTYTYATLGEIFAWLIGWDLLLEYAVGASAVAVGWSAYLQNVMKALGLNLPQYLSHAPESVPWQAIFIAAAAITVGVIGLFKSRAALTGGAGLKTYVIGLGSAALAGFGLVNAWDVATHLTSVDLPAILIILFINFFLIKGVSHTAKMTAVFVMIKVAVIIFFVGVGIWHIDTTNYHPFLPFGWHGVFTGAAIVFFAYIGFDAVTTLAEECKDPQKDVPKGVIGSLIVCTVLYILVAAVMTGAMSYLLLGGSEIAAPMARVLDYLGYWWASPFVSIGAIAGITSVLIVLLFGQSRIMMRMAKDGLISPIFGNIHEKYRTPVWSIAIWGVLVALTAGLLPISELAELTNIGTLAAFVMVCAGVMILRVKEPERPRKFRCPDMPLVKPVGNFAVTCMTRMFGLKAQTEARLRSCVKGVAWMLIPILGAGMSMVFMFSLPGITWIRFFIWMGVGVVIYMFYGRVHSKLNKPENK
ncbi:MAG: amino acid permease [Candidatus Melainabacteria bacterium]|nr:amino acid permease [Candidatus Melainabacteria bacterium]